MSAEGDILVRLSLEMPNFSKRQKKIAAYICENCGEAAFMTAEMLSDAAGVSESTVVRFAVELGYDGYPRLRQALQSVLKERMDSAKLVESELSPVGEVFEKSLSADCDGLRISINKTNLANFEYLTGLITGAPEIYILAVGIMHPLAEYLEYKLSFIRRGVRALRENLLDVLSDIPEGTLFIVLGSDKGPGPRIAFENAVRDRGGRIAFLCSGEPELPLSRADCYIKTENTVGLMSIINALSSAIWTVMKKDPAEKIAEIQKIRMEFEKNEQ